jgi:hypothetical protein
MLFIQLAHLIFYLDDEKPRRVQRPDLNARQQQSDSEEDENHQNFRGHGF